MSDERPRASVRSHLRHLMAATAVLGLAAATTRSAGSAPTAPRPDAGATGDAGDAGKIAPTISGLDDAGIDGALEGDAAPAPCPPDMERRLDGQCHAYAVVDPLPQPSRGGCGCHNEPGMASGRDPEPVE